MSVPADPRATVAERRVVTVLFADLDHSTAAAAATDVERLRAGLAVVYDRLRQIIEAHGGTVEKYIGDAIMAVFGVPTAHEDDPERAVRAALEIHKLSAELSATLPFPVRFQIGVNTGEVATGVSAGRDFLVTGLPVTLAAHLYSAAEPGMTLVGPLTKDLTHGAVRYAGEVKVAAKSAGEILAWRVDDVLAPEPIGITRGVEGLRAPMIGRDQELERLLAAIGTAERERRPQLVTILGDAGVGKSRLLRELSARISHPVHVGRSLPYGEAVEHHAIRSVILALAGGEAADTTDEATALRARVIGRWPTDLGARIADRLAVLAGLADVSVALAGVAAEDVPGELRWAFRRLADSVAGSALQVIAFEDVHWATPALLDLIDEAAELCTQPVVFCCLARPDLIDIRPGWGSQGAHATTTRLRPLDGASSERLLVELLKVARLPTGFVDDVVTRAGGNPLYLEEIVRGLIAAGHLRRTGEGWDAASETAATGVPDTLRGVITARLDRLSPSAKRVLQRASVLGRTFGLRSVRALLPDESSSQSLQEAVRAEFLVPADEVLSAAAVTYRFRHALIRDAVYGSIPKHERRALHERAATWLESTQKTGAEDVSELIAHHLEQAYLLAEDLGDPDRANIGRRAYAALIRLATRDRWRRMEPVTAAVYDRAEAIATRILIPIEERKEDIAWRAVARHAPRHGDAEQPELFGALEQVRGLGPTPALARLLGAASFHAGDKARDLAAESLAVAKAVGDAEEIGWAMWWIRAHLDRSDHAGNARVLEEVIDHARRHDLRPLLANALAAAGFRSWQDGEFGRALRALAEAYAVSKGVGNSGARAESATQLAVLHAILRDRPPVQALVQEAIAAVRESRNPLFIANTLWRASDAECSIGALDVARDHAEEALTLIDPLRATGTATATYYNLSHIYRELGDLARSRLNVEAFGRYFDTDDKHGWTGYAFWLEVAGRLAAAEGDHGRAESQFRESFDILAQKGRTYLWGVPSSMNLLRANLREALADTLVAQGRLDEARHEFEAAREFWTDPLAAKRRAEIDAKIAALAR